MTVSSAVAPATSVALFDSEARRLAVARSLPLLATYFASAETWELVAQPAVSDLQGQVDAELAGAIRLRVLLALAEELLPILQTILARPTFRYAQRSDESVGLLAGRLDVPRYIQRRGRRTAPKVYPVRVVERDHATPENVLAVSALQAISRALRAVPTYMLPSGSSPERRQLALVRGDLRRYERMPLAVALGVKAAMTTRRRLLANQRLDVLRRMERGDLRRTAPYRRLTDWVQSFLTGAGVEPQSRLWAFYDERFDPRLFEIWTLSALAECLTERYGKPDGGRLEPLWARQQVPIGTWTTPYGRIELFFQRETGGLGLPGRWTIPSRSHRVPLPKRLCATTSAICERREAPTLTLAQDEDEAPVWEFEALPLRADRRSLGGQSSPFERPAKERKQASEERMSARPVIVRLGRPRPSGLSQSPRRSRVGRLSPAPAVAC